VTDNVKTLAGNLGISPKQLAKLARKHGDDLESVLSKWWNEMEKEHNQQEFLGKGGGYVSSAFAAMKTSEPDDPRRHPEPRIDKAYQRVITKQANVRWTLYVNAERADEVAEQQGKQLARKLRKLQVEAAKYGVDITPRLVAMIQEAEAEIAEHRKAA
jgi:hypothetical protein